MKLLQSTSTEKEFKQKGNLLGKPAAFLRPDFGLHKTQSMPSKFLKPVLMYGFIARYLKQLLDNRAE